MNNELSPQFREQTKTSFIKETFMASIVHCADLHLKAGEEVAYCFGILEEIVELTLETGSDFLLICGDLFDTAGDAAQLGRKAEEVLAKLSGEAEIIYITGNHDPVEQNAGVFGDSEHIHVCVTRPFELVQRPEVEFLCFPFTDDYSGYHDWGIPEKGDCARIALAHGHVLDMGVYAGPEEPGVEDAGVIDPDLFARNGVDYAALGHIHAGRSGRVRTTQMSYPGSARVWRRGETGPRFVNFLTVGAGVSSETRMLKTAGQYRLYELPIEMDGSIDTVDQISDAWEEKDWIDLVLSGVVESEQSVRESIGRMEEKYQSRVRRLRFDVDGVQYVSGILDQPLARAFVNAWREREPDIGNEQEMAVWMKARALGLSKIKEVVEARG